MWTTHRRTKEEIRTNGKRALRKAKDRNEHRTGEDRGWPKGGRTKMRMRKVKGRTGQNVNMTGQRREERGETSAERMKWQDGDLLFTVSSSILDPPFLSMFTSPLNCSFFTFPLSLFSPPVPASSALVMSGEACRGLQGASAQAKTHFQGKVDLCYVTAKNPLSFVFVFFSGLRVCLMFTHTSR